MNWKSHIEALLRAGESFNSIATAAGVTPNALREIVAGRTRSPRADAAIRLLNFRPDVFGTQASTPIAEAGQEVRDAA